MFAVCCLLLSREKRLVHREDALDVMHVELLRRQEAAQYAWTFQQGLVML